MKVDSKTDQTASFTITVPQLAASNTPNINHSLSLTFSADCNDGMTATVTATCLVAPNSETVSGGELDAFDLAGKTKTVFINAVVLREIQVTVAGRTAGTVRADYLGYGQNDPGY